MANTIPNLGKLEQVNLRKVWKHEAHDFTQWLASEENLTALSDAIGIEINLIETEASVGKFNVDILAEEENTGRKIVIENQLESTNHDHLGKIITYASGHDAEVVIWIVKSVREEHRQALDWLNEHTDDQTYFFLVKMEAWRIGDSNVAPKFNIVSQPNDWAKAIKAGDGRRDLTETKLLQLDYWLKMKEYAAENSKIRFGNKARPQHWYDISMGRSDGHISLTLNKFNGLITCKIYIANNPGTYEEFELRKEEIENALGYHLKWDILEGRKASEIYITKKADYRDSEKWNEQFEWLLSKVEDFHRVFGRKK
jgi:hypothetical protein